MYVDKGKTFYLSFLNKSLEYVCNISYLYNNKGIVCCYLLQNYTLPMLVVCFVVGFYLSSTV